SRRRPRPAPRGVRRSTGPPSSSPATGADGVGPQVPASIPTRRRQAEKKREERLPCGFRGGDKYEASPDRPGGNFFKEAQDTNQGSQASLSCCPCRQRVLLVHPGWSPTLP